MFCERCIQMSFRQWRVAVVVMLSTTILFRGGGVLHISIADFFSPKLRPNIFHSSVTIVINREGWDLKISPHIQGGGGWRMPNSAKLLSRIKAPT